ncbi:unnamed protein product [Ilex paraguariensis]|uniref:WAT1-related protein n=1 Tax=Ilex paraguariensis TaxID=185542 RepID=A0ABC8U4C4_9AQUA
MDKNQMFNQAKPYLAVIFLQFGYAGTSIVAKFALNQGMSHYTFAVYRNVIAAVVFAPFAMVLERPVIDQNLYYTGMKYTTATFAAAMTNILPAITFLMAWILRLEQMNIKTVHSQAKIVGTLVTVGGAMIMAGIIASGVSYYVSGLIIKVKGPVFVTLFNPLCMVIVAVMGSFILAEQMDLGRVLGAVTIVVGLYTVIWGKSKDQSISKSHGDQIKPIDKQINTINGGVKTANHEILDVSGAIHPHEAGIIKSRKAFPDSRHRHYLAQALLSNFSMVNLVLPDRACNCIPGLKSTLFPRVEMSLISDYVNWK